MKVMLLTDMPPCRNYTAGLVLERLVGFLAPGELAICSVVNPDLQPEPVAALADVPHLTLVKPSEAAVRSWPGRQLGDLSAHLHERRQAKHVREVLLPEIARFAREQQVDRLWVVLEGQTIIRLARPLAEKLDLPLYTQVWDPFEWWLRANDIDSRSRGQLLLEFDRVLLGSTACATASWAMSEYYTGKYGIRNLPVIAGLPENLLRDTADAPHDRSDFVVAMAGQFYADTEWGVLLNALNAVGWTIGGRNIRVRVLGGGFTAWTQAPANFEYLGWRSQEDAIALLADADLLYMPYWFSEEFRLESSNSFPSKMVTYFAAGRPVLCHAPAYASPARYAAEHGAAFQCTALDTQAMVNVLEQAVTDPEAYRAIAASGTACFQRDFTLARMRETFLEFLDADSAPGQGAEA